MSSDRIIVEAIKMGQSLLSQNLPPAHSLTDAATVTRFRELVRIDAALTELGHDPHNLNPEILATLEHLHSGGLATTRRQASRVALSEDSRVLDVGCGIGGPARYLVHTYGCRADGINLTPELIETGRALTERCKLADRVVLQVGNALDLPYPDQTFDVVWCQNVAMNISYKAGLLAILRLRQEFRTSCAAGPSAPRPRLSRSCANSHRLQRHPQGGGLAQ